MGFGAGCPKMRHSGILLWIKVTYETANTRRMFWPSFVSLKAGNKSPMWKVSSLYIKRKGEILITREREFGAQKTMYTNLVTSSLMYYLRLKLHLVSTSQIHRFLVKKVWIFFSIWLLLWGSSLWGPRRYKINTNLFGPVNLSFIAGGVSAKKLEGKREM